MAAESPTPPWRVLDETLAPAPSNGLERGPAVWLGLLGLAALAVVGALVVAFAGGGERPDLTVEPAATAGVGAEPTLEAGGSAIVVDVGGAVRRPGVYRLPVGSRVGDAIEAAGGYGPDVDAAAAERSLNLAARLEDGAEVTVPVRGDPAAGGPTTTPGRGPGEGGSTGRIDLNTATEAELDTLPGIGPVTAGKIVAAREEAAFTSVDDLRARRLVGPATFEKIRDLVTVGR